MGKMGTMAEIIELRPPRTGLDDQIFKAVREMQDDLRALDEFADALALVSETMDESPHPILLRQIAVGRLNSRARSAHVRQGQHDHRTSNGCR